MQRSSGCGAGSESEYLAGASPPLNLLPVIHCAHALHSRVWNAGHLGSWPDRTACNHPLLRCLRGRADRAGAGREPLRRRARSMAQSRATLKTAPTSTWCDQGPLVFPRLRAPAAVSSAPESLCVPPICPLSWCVCGSRTMRRSRRGLSRYFAAADASAAACLD